MTQLMALSEPLRPEHVDYETMETADLKRLADLYVNHHADAHDAYEAGGRVDGSIWDDAMRRYMAHMRAIDGELLARGER